MAFKTFTSGAVLTAAEINTYLMQQAVIVCTSSTRPSAPVEGMRIAETDTDLEYQYTGSAWIAVGNFGGWTAYTPTLTQSGAVTKTVTRASWTRIGRLVIGDFELAVTGTGTASNAIKVGLPVAAAAGYTDGNAIGSGFWNNTGTAFYVSNLGIVDDNAVQFYSGASAAAGSPLGATSSPDATALASGDSLRGTFTYEAAS